MAPRGPAWRLPLLLAALTGRSGQSVAIGLVEFPKPGGQEVRATLGEEQRHCASRVIDTFM